MNSSSSFRPAWTRWASTTFSSASSAERSALSSTGAKPQRAERIAEDALRIELLIVVRLLQPLLARDPLEAFDAVRGPSRRQAAMDEKEPAEPKRDGEAADVAPVLSARAHRLSIAV